MKNDIKGFFQDFRFWNVLFKVYRTENCINLYAAENIFLA